MAVSELWSLYCAFATCSEVNVVVVDVVVVVVVSYLAVVTVLRIQVTISRFVTSSVYRRTV
jgi:hypothetical protein